MSRWSAVSGLILRDNKQVLAAIGKIVGSSRDRKNLFAWAGCEEKRKRKVVRVNAHQHERILTKIENASTVACRDQSLCKPLTYTYDAKPKLRPLPSHPSALRSCQLLVSPRKQNDKSKPARAKLAPTRLGSRYGNLFGFRSSDGRWPQNRRKYSQVLCLFRPPTPRHPMEHIVDRCVLCNILDPGGRGGSIEYTQNTVRTHS